MNKKGNAAFEKIAGLGIAIAILAVALAVTFLIISTTRTQIGTVEGIDANNATQCATSLGCNATNDISSSVATIPTWLPIIIIVVMGGIVIGVVRIMKG